MRFWEVRRVIRGYRRRNILHYQLQRINAWASMFCMGNPHHKEPADIVKLYFDDELDDAEDSQASHQRNMQHYRLRWMPSTPS